MHDWLVAVVLGAVEGLTEFLPVSSTGHMILAGELLRFAGERAATFEIAIQLGAILAVLVVYRHRFAALLRDGMRGRALLPATGRPTLTWSHLAVACAPAFVAGFLFHGLIKGHLFSSQTVLAGLVAGGVFMIAAEARARRRRGATAVSVDQLTLAQALAIGCVQCLSLWPGFSRSGSTISGGLFFGLDRRTAAEFSFIVAVPVMLAAVGYDLVSSLDLLDRALLAMMALGFVVAFAVAWLAVVSFLSLVQRMSLTPFAAYRFVLAAVYALVVVS